MTARVVVAATALLIASAAPIAAQGRPPERGALEQRVGERIARVVQERLGLDAEQMRALQATNRKFEAQRRALMGRERVARTALRDQVAAGERADQARVAALLDSLLSVQRERLDLIEQEQRELAGFLTPVQRARYLVLQDQMRRRVDEMRQRRGGAVAPRGRSMPPR